MVLACLAQSVQGKDVGEKYTFGAMINAVQTEHLAIIMFKTEEGEESGEEFLKLLSFPPCFYMCSN